MMCHDVSPAKKKSKTSAQSWCTRAVRLGPTRVSYSLSNLTPDAVSSSSNLNFFRFHFKILGLSAVWSSKPFVLDARWRPFLRQHPHRFKGAHQTHVLDFPCYLHALPTSKNWLLDACCVSCITRTIGTIGVLHLWHGVKYLEHIFHGWTLKAVSSSMHPPCTVWIACIPHKLWRFWDQPLPLLSSCGAPRSENKPFGHKMIQHATNLWQNLSFQQLLPKWLKYAQILIQMCPEISKKQLAPASKDSWIGAVGGLLGAVVGMLGML